MKGCVKFLKSNLDFPCLKKNSLLLLAPSNFKTFRRLWTVILVLFYHPKKNKHLDLKYFFCVIMTKTNNVSLPNIAGTTSLLFTFLYVAINIYQILSLFVKLFQEFWKISQRYSWRTQFYLSFFEIKEWLLWHLPLVYQNICII